MRRRPDRRCSRASPTSAPMSVDLAAPGVTILSSIPSFANLVADGFEDTPTTFASRWVATGTWGRELFSFNPPPSNNSASDSPGVGVNYLPSSDTSLRTAAGTNLAGRAGCSLEYWFNLATELNQDIFRVEAATSAAGPWTVLAGWSGATGPTSFAGDVADLAAFDGLTTFLRLRLTSDADGIVGTGVRVEDLVLRCLTTPPPAGDLREPAGHVDGLARTSQASRRSSWPATRDQADSRRGASSSSSGDPGRRAHRHRRDRPAAERLRRSDSPRRSRQAEHDDHVRAAGEDEEHDRDLEAQVLGDRIDVQVQARQGRLRRPAARRRPTRT